MWNDQGRRQHCNHRARHGPTDRRVCDADKGRRRTCAEVGMLHLEGDFLYLENLNFSIFTLRFWPKGVLLVRMLLPHILKSAHYTTVFKGPVGLQFVCVSHSMSSSLLSVVFPELLSSSKRNTYFSSSPTASSPF